MNLSLLNVVNVVILGNQCDKIEVGAHDFYFTDSRYLLKTFSSKRFCFEIAIRFSNFKICFYLLYGSTTHFVQS